MAAPMEDFPKMKAHFPLIHRAGHLILTYNEAGEALFALSKSTLAVSDHLDYCEAACGIQADLYTVFLRTEVTLTSL